MDEKSVADVFRVEDPEIDVAQLVARIREGLAAHPWVESDLAQMLKSFGGEAPDETDDETVRAIARLALMLTSPLPSNRLRPAGGAKDRLLNRLRAPLHEVIRFYVDTQVERHDEMIRQIYVALRAPHRARVAEQDRVETLGRTLADDAAAFRAAVDALRAEVAGLRAEVNTLRSQP